MNTVWDVLNWLVFAGIALLIVFAVRRWFRAPDRLPPTMQVVAVAAIVAYVVLGWTQGNRLADIRITEPINWPLELRIIEDVPGVSGDGACFEPDLEPGFYGPEDVEVTREEARRHNSKARACIARARRENRDYTKDWANWVSILLLGTAAVAIYHELRPPPRARLVPPSVPPSTGKEAD